MHQEKQIDELCEREFHQVFICKTQCAGDAVTGEFPQSVIRFLSLGIVGNQGFCSFEPHHFEHRDRNWEILLGCYETVVSFWMLIKPLYML